MSSAGLRGAIGGNRGGVKDDAAERGKGWTQVGPTRLQISHRLECMAAAQAPPVVDFEYQVAQTAQVLGAQIARHPAIQWSHTGASDSEGAVKA